MPKSFLTFDAQISYLETDKNLLIQDHNYAKTMLKRIGYFSLIGGYKAPFKNPTTKKYKDGTLFEDIVALYYFDENLRELFLKYILKIERHIRALLSYHFTEKYGEQQSEYLNPANYAMSRRNAGGINRLVATMGNLANHNSDYPYINHQRQAYGNVPLWVLFNGVTFGSLSKFYTFATQDIQSKVAKNFKKASVNQSKDFASNTRKCNFQSDFSSVILKHKDVFSKNSSIKGILLDYFPEKKT